MKTQALLNADVRFLPDDVQDLLRQSATRPLTDDELVRLSDVIGDRTDGMISGYIVQATESPRTIYHGTRGAVGEVVQDNLLKNIPENYVYINRDVAVPIANLRSAKGKEFGETVKNLLKSDPVAGSFGGLVYSFNEMGARRLLRYLGSKGIDISAQTRRALRLAAGNATSPRLQVLRGHI